MTPTTDPPGRTRMQFGGAPPATDRERAPTPADIGRRRCPACARRFSGDAGFCPFDGERLQSTDEPTVDPLVGSTVDGRYEVKRVLGEGGMGTVYEVRHSALGRPFAMKVLRADLADENDLAARFTREARAAAAIAHGNVVQITDFGTLPTGPPYFVMELLDGPSLTEVLRQGSLPRDRALDVLAQVARGLEAAHRAGIVHRDLKPDNVVVLERSPGVLVKVVDFGLARIAGQSRLTKKGMVFGTPHYMSPEQAIGAPVGEQSDQYALGVLMYEAFTGRIPFEADTYMGVMTQHVYSAPTPPRKVIDDGRITGDVERVILRCLEKEPSKRYASMAELADVLESLRTGQAPPGALSADRQRPGVASPDPRGSAPRDRPSPATLWGVIALAAVVLTAAAWGGGLLRRADAPDGAGRIPERDVTPQGVPAAPPARAASLSSAVDRATSHHAPTTPSSTASPLATRRKKGPSPGAAPLPAAAPDPPEARPTPPKRLAPRGGGEIVDPWGP